MENHSILESSFFLGLEIPFPDIKFNADAVISVYEHGQDACRKAISKIYDGLTYEGLREDELKELYDSIFGELNSSHPFRYANQIGFDVTEPQITKGIAYFIDPLVQGEKGTRHLVAFIYALLGSQSKNKKLLGSLSSSTAHAFQVKAEFSIENKRADIFMRWKDKKELFGVIVEAKFGHKVTDSQLSPYKDYFKDHEKEHYALILLTLTGENAPRGFSDWQPKSWFAVMKHWEQHLTKKNEVGFSFLRQFIWNKLRS